MEFNNQNLGSKQARIDELIRDTTKLRKKQNEFKCPYCDNGKKVPEKLL